jgi:hypothetical protein
MADWFAEHWNEVAFKKLEIFAFNSSTHKGGQDRQADNTNEKNGYKGVNGGV